MIKLINNVIFETNIELIINRKLFERKIIDENTYSLVNDFLLKKLRQLQKERRYI